MSVSAGARLPQRWPTPDGGAVACREKLKVLAENLAELETVMQDAFEDAVLMGVDPAAARAIFRDLADALRDPRG